MNPSMKSTLVVVSAGDSPPQKIQTIPLTDTVDECSNDSSSVPKKGFTRVPTCSGKHGCSYPNLIFIQCVAAAGSSAFASGVDTTEGGRCPRFCTDFNGVQRMNYFFGDHQILHLASP